MKKLYILFLLLTPFLGFSQTTVASYTFDTTAEGWVPGNAADTSVDYDAAHYYTASGSLQMGQLTINKVIKVAGISSITELGDYTLKFKIKGAETGANIKGNLRTTTNYPGDALLMSSLPSSTGGDGATWYEYSSTITIATINATNSQIQLQTNTLGTYYIDDVVIIKEPLAGNTLTVSTVGAGDVALTLDKISYADTDTETLTANPTTHWVFDNWTGDLTGSTNPETLLMDADKTVTANFIIDSAFDYSFTFDTDDDSEGWAGTNGTAVVATGLYTFTPEADKFGKIALTNFPVPSADYKYIQITLKNNTTHDDGLRVVVGAENITLPISVSDATMKVYEFDLSTLTTWTGDVSDVTITFRDEDNAAGVGKSSGTGSFDIASIVFSNSTLSIDNVDLKDDVSISLYPNPVQHILNVKASSNINKIEVYNILGQHVLSIKNSNSIDVQHLNKGAYITKIFQDNDIVSTKRFFKD